MPETEAAAPTSVFKIPVVKAKGKSVLVDLALLSDADCRELMLMGLKVWVNQGASKITAANIPDEAERANEAMVVAQKRADTLVEDEAGAGTSRPGVVKTKKAAATKVAGVVKTEARRLARIAIKEAIKDSGAKVSHYKPSEITALANELLEGDEGPAFLSQAETNLKSRAEKPVKISLAGLKPDARKVQEDEDKKAAKKATLSAAKAGQVTKRAGKGKGGAQANA